MRSGVAQNSVHLFGCPLVGDGRGRAMEEAVRDPEWCREMAVS